MPHRPYNFILRRNSILSGKQKRSQTTQSFPTFPQQKQCNQSILPLITSAKSLTQTKHSHALAIINNFLPKSISVSSALTLQYATFGDISTPILLFHQSLPFSRSAFLWNTIIRAKTISGVYDKFEIYNLMIRSGVKPDDHTFPFVLKVCTDWNEIKKGLEVHGLVWKLGFESDVFVGNTLMRFYNKCVGVDDAYKVFDEMPERDVVSWNTVIGVSYSKGMALFRDMMARVRVRPNAISFVTVLPVCAAVEDCVMVSEIHGCGIKMGFCCNITVNNALVDAYGKSRDLRACMRVFEEMVEKNDVSWNAVITSLAHVGYHKDAIDFFESMIEEGVIPNPVAVSSLLPVLVELGYSRWGVELHGFSVRRGMESDIFVANSLLDMYAKFGYPDKASNVFNNIDPKNVVSWNAMVANYAQNGFEILALNAVTEMQTHYQVPNAVTLTNVLPACARIGSISHGKQVHARSIRGSYDLQLFISNALIDMYAKCGYLNLARRVFDVSCKECKDLVSYNTLISAYSHTNASFESLVLFRELLLKGLEPDAISFSSALSACANMAEIKIGKEIHAVCVRAWFYNHPIVSNSVLDLYTKCGLINLAQKVFDQMPSKETASWNTIIMGYGMRGEIDTAISLFEAMKDENHEHVKCDSITYIVVLSVCSHGGLVDLGKKYFEEMKEHKIKPTQTHYACMVDLLGRAGLMDEAVEMISRLETEPGASVWGSLLGACRIHGNVELGQWAADHIFKLKPGHSGYYMLLSNMYADAGRWHEADKIRELMKSKGVHKNPGFSSVQQPHNG